MAWAYKRYGTVTDPVHKSHLNRITGDYGCPAQFRYEMDSQADATGHDDDATVSGNTAAGTAAHETIARALTTPRLRTHLLRGGTVNEAHVAAVFREELDRETSTRPVNWGKDDPDTVSAERVAMITGLLNDIHRYVAAVELVEAGFIAACGDYWISGHIDLVYRPRSNPDALAIADWKSGATVPSDLVLDHGWEAGVYSAAVYAGAFLPREHMTVTQAGPGGLYNARCGVHAVSHPSRYVAERKALERGLMDMAQAPECYPDALHFASFPAEIYHVALIHYLPYKRGGKRTVKRPEDLRFYGYDRPTEHKYVAGDRRGPGWLPVRVTEHDVPRLESRLRNVVGMIRMGRFIDQVGDKCRRCAWADQCLNSGYAPRGAERTMLERRLRLVDDADTAALSLD